MKKHLQYLQDPVKLADAVKQCLSQEKLEEAQELVEAASRKALVTVSWNHVINYLLGKKRVNAAIKVFNDVSIESSRWEWTSVDGY
jgi:pentatricopeptide repeat protein